jgi:uncharacterized protein
MEIKQLGLTELKLAPSNAEAMTFAGYGAVFGNVDSYGDVIKIGAFTETLREAKAAGQWPAMLLQHGGGFLGGSAQDMTPIGVWSDLSEDGHGLKVEGKLADTPRGREAYALLKMTPRPAITGLSIGFIPKEWQMRARPEEPRRTLKKVDLVEVSLVTFPANSKARIGSVKAAGLTEQDLMQWLVQAGGLSQREAQAIAGHGFKGLQAMREEGSVELAQLADALKRRGRALSTVEG